MKELDLIDQYEAICEKHFLNKPYPHEILLMTSDEQIKKAIKEVKMISFKVYEEVKRIHKMNGRKSHYAVIDFDVSISGGGIKFNVDSRPISHMSKKEISAQMEKIKAYKNNHPEKCYLKKLQQEMEKR